MMWPFSLLRDSDEDEDCDTFDHDYGPWTDFRWEHRLDSSGDNLVLKVGYELRRTCRDCGDTDWYWRPNQFEKELDVEWYHGEYRGSECNAGLPIIENGDSDD